MLDCFLFLITEGASFLMAQTLLSYAISSPTTVLEGQPNEELATKRSPALPNFLPRREFNGTCEKSSIGRFAAIRTRLGELPMVQILDILLKR